MNERTVEAAAALGRDALAPLVGELARRMGASDRPVTTFTVTLDEAARTAVAELLGLPRLPPSTYRIRTSLLAAALQVEAGDLRDVVEAVAGPLGNRSATRAAARDALHEASVTARLRAEPLGPGAVEWAEASVRTLPGPVEERSAAVHAAIDALVAAREQRLPLPVLAAQVAMDPHAFDAGTRGGDVLVAGAAAAAGCPTPRAAVERRHLLARFGIVADELSSTVELWRFPFPDSHPLHTVSSELTDAGEPFVATLAMVQRWPVKDQLERILVVENPAVLAVAADRCYDRPLVCSSGQPSAACASLVAQLVATGTPVDVHADFDPGGFSIVTTFHRLGATPWRMGADDYLAAVGRAAPHPVTGTVPATPWDPDLAAAFVEHRRPVYEEQVLDVVLSQRAVDPTSAME